MKKLYILSLLFVFSLLILVGCNKDQVVTNTALPQTVKVELQEQIDTLESQKDDISFPSWLSKLNIFAPQDMKIDKELSYQTTKEVEWFESVHFVYTWEYNYAMKQAKIIADNANIPISAEFKMAQDIIDGMDAEKLQMKELLWDMKWIVYTNYNLMDKKSPDYTIAITVNENWSLELDVTDMLAMEKVTDEFIK